MPGLQTEAKRLLLTDNGQVGYVSVSSVSGLYVGALAYVSSDAVEGREYLIVALSGHNVSLRLKSSPGYGVSDLTDYLVADGAVLDVPAQLVHVDSTETDGLTAPEGNEGDFVQIGVSALLAAVTRADVWKALGVWIGPTPPLNPTTYAQWAENPSAGYFAYMYAEIPGANIQAVGASMELTGGVPSVVGVGGDVGIQAVGASMQLTGGVPTTVAQEPGAYGGVAADMSLTGGVPTTAVALDIGLSSAGVMELLATAPSAAAALGIQLSSGGDMTVKAGTPTTTPEEPAGPTISFVGSNSAAATITGDGLISIPEPADVANGDIIICVINTGAAGAPTGYTTILDEANVGLFWKRSNGTPGNAQIQLAGDPEAEAIYSGITVAFRNCVASGSPIHVASASSAPAATNFSGPTVNTTVGNTMVCMSLTSLLQNTNATNAGGSVSSIVNKSSAQGLASLFYGNGLQAAASPITAPTGTLATAAKTTVTFALKT